MYAGCWGDHMSDLDAGDRRKLTISEIMAGVSFILSAGSCLFTAGVIYGQTQDNTRRVAVLEQKVDQVVPDIAGMKSDIKYLVQAEISRQARRDND